MPTNDWPSEYKPSRQEQERNLEATNDTEIAKAVSAIAGGDEYMKKQIREQVEAALAKANREAQLDRIDRRYLRFPEVERGEAASLLLRKVRGEVAWEAGDRPVSSRALGLFFRSEFTKTRIDQLLGADADPMLVRALSTTADEGGQLIPPGFVDIIVKDIPRKSVLFNRVRKVPVGDKAGTIPTFGNTTGAWGSEGVEMDPGSIATDDASYTIRRVQCFQELTREILSDANPDMVMLVVEAFQSWMAQERDRVIVTGNGTNRPQGIYSASGVTDVAVTSLTYDNLVTLKHSLEDIYHGNANTVWVGNQNHKAAMEKIKDEDGRPIFKDAPNAGLPPTILGIPFVSCRSVPNNFLALGDLDFYFWFDRREMILESTTIGGNAFKEHKLLVKLTERADGKYVTPTSVSLVRTRTLSGVTNLITPV